MQMQVNEPKPSAPQRATILLAEDEPAVRALVQRVLTNAGYRVLPAGDGVEAAKLWREHADEVDMILTDVVMPQMGGRGLVNEVLRIKPDLRVLFMSGYTEDAIVHHDIEQNAINFIEKPFSPARLLDKIQEILSR